MLSSDVLHGDVRVSGHPLLVHPDVDAWVRQRPELRRRVDWLLFELATRGTAGRPKGIVGPAARLTDAAGSRWLRSGVGGFHYYAWWFSASGWDGVADGTIAVRTIRDHDDMAPLAGGDGAAYRPRAVDDLDPLTEEQASVLVTPARVRLVVGQPGTGKTSALIFGAVREAASFCREASGLAPDARLLYVTLSRRLADLAGEVLAGASLSERAVEVVPLADVLARWAGARGSAVSDDDEERAFLQSVRGFAPRARADWQGSDRALWAEVRAHVLGAALPFRLRNHPPMVEPIVDEQSYRRVREHQIGARSARAAWQIARWFVDRRDLPSAQRTAWSALERIRGGKLDRELRGIGGLIVDEIQDLTLLQIAVLAEATRRSSELRGTPSLFLAAGDESQIVHPSGFDWGWCKDLLFDRLGSPPAELSLRTNQRSTAPIVEVANRTVSLYDELQREYRPRGSARVEPTDARNGEVALTAAASDSGEVVAWLERLAETPHTAVIVNAGLVGDGTVNKEAPSDGRPRGLIGDDRFRDLCFTPAEIKGLDRQYVVIWDATRTLNALREEIDAARERGQKPRFLAARTAIDELRVAVSRATETLVFADPPDAEPDPLLAELVSDGLAQRRSPAFLCDRLEERNADPLARVDGFVDDALGLLDGDLDRAVRTLVRVDAALAELVDLVQRREVLARAAVVRRAAATALVHHGRYAEAAEQFERLVGIGRELGQDARAELDDVAGRRYREAPPGDARAATVLPTFVARYASALEALPQGERSIPLYDLPRAWLQEASTAEEGVCGPDRSAALPTLLDGARRLAELSGDERDRRAAAQLRATVADALLAARAWRKALDLLADEPDAPPEALARCYEGLKLWREAADARLRAGQPAEALEDYRRAAAFSEAAALAARLGHGELAETLGLLPA